MALSDDKTAQYLGRPVEVEDPSNANQCMDWAFLACDIMGIPRATIRHLFAYQAFTQPNAATYQHFNIIPNTPEYVPPANALAVWGTAVGRAGHIAWVLTGSTRTLLKTSDQNWNAVQRIQRVDHNYRGVIGFLVPKNLNNQGVSQMGATKVTRDTLRMIHTEMEGWPYHETHAGKYDAQFNASWGGADLEAVMWEKWNKNGAWRDMRVAAIDYYNNVKPSVEKQVKSQMDQITSLTTTIGEKDKAIASLTAENDALKKQIANTPSGGLDQSTIDTIRENNGLLKQIWAKITGVFK
jgi:hypothetical protein